MRVQYSAKRRIPLRAPACKISHFPYHACFEVSLHDFRNRRSYRGNSEYCTCLPSAAADKLIVLQAPLLAKIPEVRKLVLKNLQGLDAISSPDVVAMTHLEELRLRDCYGILYPQALPSLRILRVCGHRVLIQPSSHSEIPGYRGPSLVELTLKDNHFSDMLLISRLLGSRSGTLRTLKISGCNRVNLSWLLVKIMQRGALDEVVDLDLGATDVTDQAIEISTPTLRNLRCISLDRTNVTGIAVKALILKPGTKLEYLGISECDRISADAVEFARKQPGLTLKSGSNSDAKGRKVRYG